MYLREYRSLDCKYLAELFYQTVHSVNAKDYTLEQLNAWASGDFDLTEWNESFLKNYTVIAVENNQIVGFGDIDEFGYLNRLFVHKDYQNRGIASAICDKLEQAVSVKKIVTHASITAKSFFEKRGYNAINEQFVVRKGIPLKNFVLEKQR